MHSRTQLRGSISGSCSVVAATVSCTDAPGTWFLEVHRHADLWCALGCQVSTQSNPVFISAASGLSLTGGVVGSSAQIYAQGFVASKSLTVSVGGIGATITSGGDHRHAAASTTVTFTIPSVPSGAQTIVVSDRHQLSNLGYELHRQHGCEPVALKRARSAPPG